MPHTVQSRPDAETLAERAPFRVVLGKVSLLLVVALALSASVRSVEGFTESSARGGTHARDAVRLLTTTAQQAVRRLAQRDQVKPIALSPDFSRPGARLSTGRPAPAAPLLVRGRDLLRPERLDLPPPGIA